ncbi:MAG: Hsp20/alpha crystallin family protein, partial [Candidatus Thermoplasmatota archaeon]|nr:Hsp20/alpha crystallin family protein [Candidatus Thermoplasmatota archaeon]
IAVLNELLTVYDESELAKLLKCDPPLIKKWLRKAPSNKYMPKILGLAFFRSPNIGDILKETLTELDSLAKLLGIKDVTSKLGIFMKELDEKSREIVWYLLRNGHANIRELAEITNARTDNEVLVRVRELINPKSKEVFGKEIMKFEEAKINSVTGEKILFSWWLTENILPLERAPTLLDVFDENSRIKIVAELPRVKEDDIKIDIAHQILTISTNGYQKTIPLFCKVKKIEKTYRNGILELKLEKAME